MLFQTLSAVAFGAFAAYLILRRSLAKAEATAKSERDGRIKMQIALGARQQAAKQAEIADVDSDEAFLRVAIIGHITSPYSTRNGTPRQPSLVPSAKARLVLQKSIPKSSLQALSEFSHAWIIFHFHQNTNIHKSQFKGTIKPPRLNGASVGVFSTRTPHRPAPVGLSLGRIIEVNVSDGWILFQGLDLVHGTPVIDIKPYVAFSDTPTSLVTERVLQESTEHYAPPWVTKDAENHEPLSVDSVVLSDTAKEQIAGVFTAVALKKQRGGVVTHSISLYPSVDLFLQFIVENMMLDFRSTRERADPKFTAYRVTLCDIVIHYHFTDDSKSNSVVVTGAEVLRSDLTQPLNQYL
ncbi:hypothetical protein HK100_012610 [Physocladia obscura]|uniref:TsaA-like domain-containing protein n=1 Tax=Physocladia obscura TaxID=109957 RepID=A0AAD5XD33_9FUNG|nr:hypothetical protein HK100_012610 [Physocladia obscura]